MSCRACWRLLLQGARQHVRPRLPGPWHRRIRRMHRLCPALWAAV